MWYKQVRNSPVVIRQVFGVPLWQAGTEFKLVKFTSPQIHLFWFGGAPGQAARGVWRANTITLELHWDSRVCTSPSQPSQQMHFWKASITNTKHAWQHQPLNLLGCHLLQPGSWRSQSRRLIQPPMKHSVEKKKWCAPSFNPQCYPQKYVTDSRAQYPPPTPLKWHSGDSIAFWVCPCFSFRENGWTRQGNRGRHRWTPH